MGKSFITDEVNTSYVAKVGSNKALKAQPEYTSIKVLSGTGTGWVTTGAAWIGRVIVGGSANGGRVVLQAVTASADIAAVGANASAIADIDISARGTYVYDFLADKAVAYRVSAADAGTNIQVIYTQ